MTAELLLEAAKIGGVKTVAIVDDAYDPPKPEEISENAYNQFAQALDENSDLFVEISRSSGLTEDDLDDWDRFLDREKLIVTLWAIYVGTEVLHDISPVAKAALGKLFGDVKVDRTSKLTQLEPLDRLLSTFKGKVIRLSSSPDPRAVAKADVVFLDLYLSDEAPSEVDLKSPSPRSVYDRARDRAIGYLKDVRRVTDKKVAAIAPAFILISSQGSDIKAENFRKHAGQMASRFRFVSKKGLRDNNPHELLAIADIFRTCGACAIVEPIQKAWFGISQKGAKWIHDKLFDLDISDFGHLYHLRLHKEGQPIEEYVKEIIASALAERICCEFSAVIIPKNIRNPFESVLCYFEAPSNGFAELYGATRISQDLGVRGTSGLDPRSGDLFLLKRLPKRSSTPLNKRRVIAVMSPPCDLIDRSGAGPATKSVLLLEGTLLPATSQHDSDSQVVYVRGKYYEIKWELKHPSTMKMDVFKQRWRGKSVKWRNNSLTWLGRLKGEHFLGLQSEYLSKLGRVGLMKSPAIYQSLSGAISVKHSGQEIPLGEKFTIDHLFAYICIDHTMQFENQPISFTGSFLKYFSDVLKAGHDNQQLNHGMRRKLQDLSDNMNQVANLIEIRKAKSHGIPNILTVVLQNSPTAGNNIPANDIVVVRVWPH